MEKCGWKMNWKELKDIFDFRKHPNALQEAKKDWRLEND